MKFHITPTSASWLNQVEVWFLISQGQSLSGASFTSLKQLQQHVDAYINAYNESAQPFVWTKKKVRQRRFKGRRITELLIPGTRSRRDILLGSALVSRSRKSPTRYCDAKALAIAHPLGARHTVLAPTISALP